MAGNWGSDTSGSDSDTETGDESLLENPMAIALQTIAQYQTSSQRNDSLMDQPPGNEVIIVSSEDEDSFSDSSGQSLEQGTTSYATSSPSTASESSNSPSPDNDFRDSRLFLTEYLQASSLVFPTVDNEYSSVPGGVSGESSRDYTSSPEPFNIQEAIERRLPSVDDLSPFEVTLTSGRKMTVDFPSARSICKKGSGNDTRCTSVTWCEDSSASKKNRKYDPDSPSVVALKRYQVSTISEAIWRPEERKAEVVQRRGKQLETVGSAGDPMLLEFYEAMYLMTRVKLRLLLADLTPMTVFDAYDAMIRHDEDSELYSIYEHLMDSGAIVAPFRSFKRKTTNHSDDSSCPGEQSIAQNIPPSVQPPKASVFSAYKKDDSDSDLEVLSCSMPTAPKVRETALTYEQSSPYEGPEIEFPRVSVSMDHALLRMIPRELLPECRTAISPGAPGTLSPRIPVTGLNVKLQPHWFTAEGREESERVKENKATPKRTRKRKNSVKTNAQRKKQKLSHQNHNQSSNRECFPQSGENGAMQERYSRRWFPRWFDGVELGVHSLSIVDTLHKYTGDGIPRIESAQSWSQYKNVFAKLVKESHDQRENNCLCRGNTTPLMTGTKKNQTQLIFGELQLTQEITEVSEFRKRLEDSSGTKSAAHAGCSPEERQSDSCSERGPPEIIFDVFTDSAYSKTKPCTPDYRVVRLKASSVLKINDLLKLSLEAGDATLLMAHVADGKVRMRQAMTFSIPRYN